MWISLSEQELVACDHFKDKTGSDQGCQGGWPDRAFQWIIQNDGLTTEDNYPSPRPSEPEPMHP